MATVRRHSGGLFSSEMEGFLRVNPGLGRRFQVRFDFKDYDAAELAAIFVKIVQRNDFKLSEDASLTAVESILSSKFAPALRRRWNGGLPEACSAGRGTRWRRLNVLTMSADTASTLEKRDVVQGAQILAATLGDAHDSAPTPPPPPRRLPSGFEDMKTLGPLSQLNGAPTGSSVMQRPAPPRENPGQMTLFLPHFAGAPGEPPNSAARTAPGASVRGLSVNKSGSLQVRQMKTTPVVIVTTPQPITSTIFGFSARPKTINPTNIKNMPLVWALSMKPKLRL